MRARDRRAIRFGVASVIIVSVVRLTALPVIETYGAHRLDLQKERRLLADDLGLVRWADGSAAEATAIARRMHHELDALFAGADLNLVAGEIEDHVRRLAETAPLHAVQLKLAHDPSGRGTFRSVDVEVRATVEYTALLEFLRLLERDARLLGTTQLEVRAVNDQALAASLGIRSQPLDVRIRLTAFALDPRDDYASAAARSHGADIAAYPRERAAP